MTLDDNPVVFSYGLLGDGIEAREGGGRIGDTLRLLLTGLGVGLGGLGIGGPGTWTSLKNNNMCQLLIMLPAATYLPVIKYLYQKYYEWSFL